MQLKSLGSNWGHRGPLIRVILGPPCHLLSRTRRRQQELRKAFSTSCRSTCCHVRKLGKRSWATRIWSFGKIFIPTLCQFHQHLMREFFVRKCFAQLSLVTFQLCNFWCQNANAKKSQIKCWWNWHLAYHRAFRRFGQAKFPDGGSVLGSSQFSILPQLPPKILLDSKVVKINPKIILLLC